MIRLPRRRVTSTSGERAPLLLAREWVWTSRTSLLLALLAGAFAAVAKQRQETGDLLTGLYFAAVSLVFWMRAASIRLGWSRGQSVSGYIVALAAALAVGSILVIADVATAGAW